MPEPEQSVPALSLIRKYGRVHSAWLVRGFGATLGVVFFRLAMPWPLRAVIEHAFPGASSRAASLTDALPDWGDAVLWLCGAYVLLALGIGLAEMLQRLWMVTFASRTVGDLRAGALRGASTTAAGCQPAKHGDLIARLVGDAGRLREDLKGVLVHASQSALLFLAICTVFLVLSPQMGLYFLVGGLVTTWIGYAASEPVEAATEKQRSKEGAYASTIQTALEDGTLTVVSDTRDRGDERRDVKDVSIVSLSALVTHLVLAGTVAIALWTGVHQVRAGDLAPGELFLFVVYALTVHRRLVQLGRQLARVGKIRACIGRLAPLLDDLAPARSGVHPGPLRAALRLEGVTLDGSRGGSEKPRIRRLDLTIRAGSKVAIVGGAGDGKTSLLASIAGAEPASDGTIYWDDIALQGGLPEDVGYLPQDPIFLPRRVGQILGLDGADAPTPAQITTLEQLGAWRVISRLPKGLDTKVSSATLSKNEGRALSLAATVLGPRSVWVLDAPLEGLTRKAGARCLRAILDQAGDRTVVMSLPRLVEPERFDRVIHLRRGKVRFDGTPGAWESSKDESPPAVEPAPSLGAPPCKP